MVKVLKLILSIIICQLAGILGSIFTSSSVSTWYPLLEKPFFNPPSWVFAPVWTILYLLMGISLYLVWTRQARARTYIIFTVQLFLNFLWSVLFFGLRSPYLALLDIILLIGSIILTMLAFSKVSKAAAWLLLPYLIWVCFAAALNLSIWFLN